jgi:hypothetical protein
LEPVPRGRIRRRPRRTNVTAGSHIDGNLDRAHCVLLGVNRAAALVLVACVLAGCGPSSDPDEGVMVAGTVVAGPSCPVVRDPPDPACDDRPVAGAEIVVLDADGDVVTRTRTDAEGSFGLRLPAGAYQLVPQPVTGLMGTPAAIPIVAADGLEAEPVLIVYDTGIR